MYGESVLTSRGEVRWMTGNVYREREYWDNPSVHFTLLSSSQGQRWCAGYSIHSIDEVWSQLPGAMDVKAPGSITALSCMPVRTLTSRNLHLTFQDSIWSQVTKPEKETPDCTWNLLVSVHVKYKMKTEMKKERDWGREKLLSMQGDGDGHWLPCGT